MNSHPLVANRRSYKGTGNPNSKLTDDQVREIRANAEKLSNRALAEKYSVSCCTISDIRRRKRWLNVPD